MKNVNGITKIVKSSLLLMLVISISIMQGCSSSSTSANTDANPDGYYDSGTAAVKLSDDTTDLLISDLQGMVSGNRIMFMSVSEVLLYDGAITNITGNDFTATLKIYEDGVLLPDTATVSGTITTASSINGTLTGVGAGNGTFSVTYSLNNGPSDLSRINIWCRGPMNGAVSEDEITIINSTGSVNRTGLFLSGTPVLQGCDFDVDSTVLPISDVNVYEVNLSLVNCTDSTVNGAFTGYATTKSVADGSLVIAYTNGANSGSGDMVCE